MDLGLEQPHLRVVPGHEELGQEAQKEKSVGFILLSSITTLKKEDMSMR